MKNRRLKVSIGSAVFILALFAAGVISEMLHAGTKIEESSSKTEPVTLNLVYAYQNPQWSGAVEQAIQGFEAANPDIQIHYEVNYESKVYEDVLNKKIARNELGDIVQLKTPGLYAKNDILGEISPAAAGLVTSVYSLDDKVYALGAVESTTGMIYNKDIFNQYHLEPPNNYEEFISICRTLKYMGITPVGIGGSELWHMEFWVNHFFRQDVISKNPSWLKECQEGKVSWTDEAPENMMMHLKLYLICVMSMMTGF